MHDAWDTQKKEEWQWLVPSAASFFFLLGRGRKEWHGKWQMEMDE